MIGRILQRYLQQIDSFTYVIWLLLLTALGSLAVGLVEMTEAFDSNLMPPLLGVGLFLGWGLAKLPLPLWLAGFMALSVGLEILLIRIGQLGFDLLRLPLALFRVLRNLWHWPLLDTPLFYPLLDPLTQLSAKSLVLLTRLSDWLQAWVSGEPLFDPIAALMVWALLLWGTAWWAGWGVRRYANPLLALTPAGIILVTLTVHFRGQSTPLIVFLGVLLLLMVLVRQHRREQRWETNRVSFTPEIYMEMMSVTLLLTGGVIVISLFLTSVLFSPLNTAIKTYIWGQAPLAPSSMATSLGIQRNTAAAAATALDPVRQGGLPRSHLLGSGPELSEQVVMRIQTDDPRPTPADQAIPRYYWRSLTYNHYTGRGWQTSRTQRIEYEAGTHIPTEMESPYRILQQTIVPTKRFNGLLHLAGEPLTINQDVTIDWRGPDDVFGATIGATSYQAQSRLPTFTIEDLRASRSVYPQWVRQRYLTLPDTVPRRVLTLALDLTATEPTPYDRAKAIEQYLRTFPYTLDLPPPPTDQDIADYFLFDLKQGYCDYYATAMVTLARAAGLPARLAVGYIHGTYDPETHQYIVTEAEAHSWVEIYFPDIGWVNFEPTGGRPAIEYDLTRPASNIPLPGDLQEATLTDFSAPKNSLETFLTWLRWGGLGLGILFLLPLSLLFSETIDRWRLARLTPATTIAALHQRLYRHAHQLRTPFSESHTPYEFLTIFMDQIDNLATRSRWREYLEPLHQESQKLIHTYVRSCYSPTHLSQFEQHQTIQLWQHLRRRLWLAQFIRLFNWYKKDSINGK